VVHSLSGRLRFLVFNHLSKRARDKRCVGVGASPLCQFAARGGRGGEESCRHAVIILFRLTSLIWVPERERLQWLACER
jgi:hypothetical protein